MRKLNNSGFVLVETLIVSVFVMSIFSILYNNFFPLMGEFEKREVYDDVDAKYATFWIKRLIQDVDVTFSQENIDALNKGGSSPGYFLWDCSYLGAGSSKEKTCNRVLESSQVRMSKGTLNGVEVDVPHIYITRFSLTDFKEKIDNSNEFSGGMHRYVSFLPEFPEGTSSDSLNGAKYRVIVEFHRTRDDNDYLAYATFEVKK